MVEGIADKAAELVEGIAGEAAESTEGITDKAAVVWREAYNRVAFLRSSFISRIAVLSVESAVSPPNFQKHQLSLYFCRTTFACSSYKDCISVHSLRQPRNQVVSAKRSMIDRSAR